MKTIITILFLVAVLIAPVGNTYAGEQDEKLQQLTAQLQSNPNNTALREEIIKLALTITPAPAVPEEAERRMARGAAAFKSAKNENDYKDAVREFEQASLAAPWSGDIYYNLGLAQDKAGDYASAVRSLKLAVLATPNSKETKNLLYEVEYRLEKASSSEAQAAKKPPSDEELLKRVDGARYMKIDARIMNGSYGDQGFEIHGKEVISLMIIRKPSSWDREYNSRHIGSWSRYLKNCTYKGNLRWEDGVEVLTISPDGRQLIRQINYSDGTTHTEIYPREN